MAWTVRDACCASPTGGCAKLSLSRYRLLHRAIEGPDKDRARWRLILEGGAEQLCQASERRQLPLQEYSRAVLEAIDHRAQQLQRELDDLPDRSDDSRKKLALRTDNCSPLERRFFFTAFDAEGRIEPILRIAQQCCLRQSLFQQMIDLLDGPKLEDG